MRELILLTGCLLLAGCISLPWMTEEEFDQQLAREKCVRSGGAWVNTSAWESGYCVFPRLSRPLSQ